MLQKFIFRKPLVSFLVLLIFALFLSFGFVWKWRIESNVQKLFASPFGSVRANQLDLLSEIFPSAPLFCSSIVKVNPSKRSNTDMLQKDVLQQFFHFYKFIRYNISINVENSHYFDDLCLQTSTDKCSVSQILNAWDNNLDKMWADNYVHKTVTLKLNSIGEVIGGLHWNSINTSLTSVDALRVTFLLDKNKPGTMQWEQHFLQTMKDSSKLAELFPDLLFSFQSESSVSEEIVASLTSVSWIAASGALFTFIFVLSSSMLLRKKKNHSIWTKLGISIIGWCFAALSIATSFSISGLVFNTAITPLTIQSLPLFLIGIGVDSIFIIQTMFNHFAFSDSQLSIISLEDFEVYWKTICKNTLFSILCISCAILCVGFTSTLTLLNYSIVIQIILSLISNAVYMVVGLSCLLLLESKWNQRKEVKQEQYNSLQSSSTLELEEVSMEQDNAPPEVLNDQIEPSSEEISSKTFLEEQSMATESKEANITSRWQKIDEKLSTLLFKIISNPFYCLVIIGAFLVCWIVSLFLIGFHLKQDFYVSDNYPQNSYLVEFLTDLELFGGFQDAGVIMLGSKSHTNISSIDYSKPEIQMYMKKLAEQLSNAAFVKPKSVTSWYSLFQSWIMYVSSHATEYINNDRIVPPEKFYKWLEEFLDGMGAPLKTLAVQFGTNSLPFTRILFQTNALRSSTDGVNSILEQSQFWEETIQNSELGITSQNSFILNSASLIFEPFVELNKKMIIQFAACFALITVITVIFLRSQFLLIPLFIFLLQAFTTILLGVMSILNIPLNALSITNVLLSIGIATEYFSHMSKIFIVEWEQIKTSHPEQNYAAGKAVQQTVSLVWMTFLCSSISTLLGLVSLIFIPIVIIRQYFLVVLLCSQLVLLVCALLVLPAFLSLVFLFQEWIQTLWKKRKTIN